MQIQVRTDSHIEGGERFKDFVKDTVSSGLERFADKITRVQVHVQDENAHKPGDNDKRCTMEARVAGLQPVGVSHNDATVDKAVHGALNKLENRLTSMLGKLSRRD